MSNELERIANMAIATRVHLIEAMKGLDIIIQLAGEAGREDVVKAAKAAKEPVKKAAKDFNDGVTKGGGDATKIDPATTMAADKAAITGKKTTDELLRELEKKVDANQKEATSGFNLLGVNFGPDGKATLAENGLASMAVEGINTLDHRVTVLEQMGRKESFDMKTFSFCVAIGAGTGLVLGLISLWLNFGLAGPVGGIFIGAVGGSIFGLWAGNRKSDD